jgi:hypothetical protein
MAKPRRSVRQRTAAAQHDPSPREPRVVDDVALHARLLASAHTDPHSQAIEAAHAQLMASSVSPAVGAIAGAPFAQLMHMSSCPECSAERRRQEEEQRVRAEAERQVKIEGMKRRLRVEGRKLGAGDLGGPGEPGRRRAAELSAVLTMLEKIPNAKRYEQAVFLGVTERTLRRYLKELGRLNR